MALCLTRLEAIGKPPDQIGYAVDLERMSGTRNREQVTLTLPGMEDVGLSPIRRQFLELKRRQPDAILLFRLGDFFETFEDDAHIAARVLDITLTSREMGRGERGAMAGNPAQSADSYMPRLIG